METMKLQKQVTASTMLDPKILVPAIRSAFVKLDPRLMMKNPVMFVVEVVAALTTVIFVRDLFLGGGSVALTGQIAAWLWFTVLFRQCGGSSCRRARQGASRQPAGDPDRNARPRLLDDARAGCRVRDRPSSPAGP
jgi:high-affinity K+ transport system ATPase subunit B